MGRLESSKQSKEVGLSGESRNTRKKSFCKTLFRSHGQEAEFERNGPNLLIKHDLMKRLDSHKTSPGWWQQNFDTSKSRKKLHESLVKMTLEREKALTDLIKASPENVEEIFGHKSKTMEEYIRNALDVVKYYSERSVDKKEGSSSETRTQDFYYAVAHEYALEKYEWI